MIPSLHTLSDISPEDLACHPIVPVKLDSLTDMNLIL